MTERIDVNGGDIMMINPNTLLVNSYEAAFADTSRIGVPGSGGIAWLGSFSGRINNSDEEVTWTISMDPRDAWKLINMMFTQFEHLLGVKDLPSGKPGPNAQRFKAAKNRRKRK